MKERFWPWKKIADLERQLEDARSAAKFAQNAHAHLLSKHESMEKEHAASKDGIRKMAEIFTRRGLDRVIPILALLFLSVSAFGQAIQRNPVTTNTLGTAIDATYFLGWNAILSKPAWLVPPGGTGNPNAVTNNDTRATTISNDFTVVGYFTVLSPTNASWGVDEVLTDWLEVSNSIAGLNFSTPTNAATVNYVPVATTSGSRPKVAWQAQSGTTVPSGTNSGDMISYHGGSWVVEPMGQYIFTGTSTNATATNLATFVTARTSLQLTNGYSVRVTGDFVAAGSTNSGAWSKVALFRNNAGTVSLVQSNQLSGPTAGQATNWNCQYSISGTNIQFQGIGDSVETVAWKWQGFWEVVSNATQVSSGGGGGSPTPDLYWAKFNDSQAATAIADSSAEGHNGTINSTAQWRVGKSGSGGSITNNGTADFAKTTGSVVYGTNKISICFWMFQGGVHAGGTVKVIAESSANFNSASGTFIVYDNGDASTWTVAADTAAGVSYITANYTDLNDSAWHFIFIYFDASSTGGSVATYSDGVLLTPVTSNFNGVAQAFSTQQLFIGARAGTSLFSAEGIDDFRIYSGDQRASISAIMADPQ